MNNCGDCKNVGGLKNHITLEILCSKGHQPIWVKATDYVDKPWGWMCETCDADFDKKEPRHD